MIAREIAHAPLTAPGSQAHRRTFRPHIQGLRAVAVVLVLLDHVGLRVFSGGFVGVDVFFVISGFLISGHLVEGLRRTGRVRFRSFFAARARRILPAAFVTIVATAVASFFVVSPLRIGEILNDAIASALYVPNILFAIEETDYLAGTAPSPFQHFWSLGVEEQFYAVWPFLLLGAFLLTAGSRRGWIVVVATVGLLSLAAAVVTTPDAPSLAFFSPFTRAWEFAAGALVAAAGPVLTRVPTLLAQLLSWLGLAAIGYAALSFSSDTAYPGVAAVLPVAGAVLVVAFADRGRGGAGVVLCLRPALFIGMISYSLYLVHWPLLVLTHEALGLDEPLPLQTAVVLAVVSIPLAWILHRLVESPFRAVGVSTSRENTRTLAVSAGATLLLVAALIAGNAVAAGLPLTSARDAESPALSVLPAGTDFVPANITPSLPAATGDTGIIYTNGCQQGLGSSEVVSCAFGATDSQKTIALFGDSHAGRWFPALDSAAEQLGYRLDTFTKSGCRSEETAKAWHDSENATCSIWRNGVVERLNENPPDVIVLANHLGPAPDRDADKQRADWTDGLSRLLDRLPASSQVVTLADSPQFASSPVLCLSSNLDDASQCTSPRASSLNPAIRQAQADAAENHGAAVVDLTDYFCNETDCPAVIGSDLVYSDEHHLTATFSLALAAPLAERLTPILADR